MVVDVFPLMDFYAASGLSLFWSTFFKTITICWISWAKKCTTVLNSFWPQKSNKWQWFGRTCTITKKFQRLHRNPSIERYKLHPKKIRILNWWNQEVNNSLIYIYLCNHGQSKEKHENDQKSCEFLTSWSQIGCPIVNHSSNQGFSTAELGINSKDQKHEEKQ